MSGQFGWGLPGDTIADTLLAENRQRELLEEAWPARCVRQPAKAVFNHRLLTQIVDKQAADGIDGGFSFLHLERAVFGEVVNWLPQLIGSCVASGGRIVDADRMIAEAFLLGDTEEIFGSDIASPHNVSPFAPFSYRAGRRLVGMNGNQDGSLCGPHIRGKMEAGILPCSAPGLDQYTDAFPEPQNESTYRKWGADDAYFNKFSAQAKTFKLLESEKVSSGEEIKSAIVQHFKPMQICSGWAFKPKERHPTWKLKGGDPVWIYTRDTSTSWAHNMSIVAWVIVAWREFVIIRNSWGAAAHKNGHWFAIEAEEMDRWAKDQSSRNGSEIRTIGNIDMLDQTIGGA